MKQALGIKGKASLFCLSIILLFQSSASASTSSWYFDWEETTPKYGFVSGVPTVRIDPGGLTQSISHYFYVYPNCDNQVTLDCIESLEVIDQKTGQKATAKLETYLPIGNPRHGQGGIPAYGGFYEETGFSNTFNSSFKNGLPVGATSSFWKVEDLPGFKDVNLMVSVGFQARTQENLDGNYVPEYKNIDRFNIDISPVTYFFSNSFQQQSKVNCSFIDRGVNKFFCINRQDKLFKDLEIVLTLKIPQSKAYLDQTPTWQGRLSNLNLEYTGENILKISGSPISYANVTFDVPKTKENFEYIKEYYDQKYGGSSTHWQNFEKTLNVGGIHHGAGFYDLFSFLSRKFEALPILARYFSDSESREEFQLWNLSGGSRYVTPLYAPLPNPGHFRLCKDLSGYPVVYTTDAAVTSLKPPTWNKEQNAFEYQVGAAGKTLNGEKRSGYFSMLMSKEVAECFYGKQATMPKVMLAITTKIGDTELVLATSIIESQKSFLKVEAAGFGYSAKTLLIKLIESPEIIEPETKTTNSNVSGSSDVSKESESKSVSNSIPGTLASKTNKMIKSITCIKGKTAKKVTGVNPKCPAGYKKK
jgi:hypothetical protein